MTLIKSLFLQFPKLKAFLLWGSKHLIDFGNIFCYWIFQFFFKLRLELFLESHDLGVDHSLRFSNCSFSLKYFLCLDDLHNKVIKACEGGFDLERYWRYYFVCCRAILYCRVLKMALGLVWLGLSSKLELEIF